jgi:large conductance mechanosensitive channel
MRRQGKTVFGDPTPTKTCPACLSDDLNPAATKCKHCGTDLPPAESPSTVQETAP